MILFLGDTHGDRLIYKIDEVAQKQGITTIIQVGDFGIHWPGQPGGCRIAKYFQKRDRQERPGPTWYTCGGNHDNYTKLEELRTKHEQRPGFVSYSARCHYVERGSVIRLQGLDIMFLGGAESSDCESRLQDGYRGRAQYPEPWKNYRQHFKSTSPGQAPGAWWAEETPTEEQLQYASEQAQLIVPDIYVTHDCPTVVRPHRVGGAHTCDGTLTGRLAERLQELYELQAPELWFYGHHHHHQRDQVQDTKFYGCGIADSNILNPGPQGWVLDPDSKRVQAWKL